MKKLKIILYIIILSLTFQTNFIYSTDDNNSNQIDLIFSNNNENEDNNESNDEQNEVINNESDSNSEENESTGTENTENDIDENVESTNQKNEDENNNDNTDLEENNQIENSDSNINNNTDFNNEVKNEIKKYDYNNIKISRWVTPNTVYLTFDDGPSYLTSKVLDILKKENIKATFFVCGNDSKLGKKLIKRIVNEGHSIGNHTYSHVYEKIYKNEINFFKDLYKNEKKIYDVTGFKTNIIRFPGGSNNSVSLKYGGFGIMDRINSILIKKNYSYYDWNATSGDAATPPPTKDKIIFNVLYNSSKLNNPIVLMHDSYKKINTIKALPIIIKKLKEFGYSFKPIDRNVNPIVFNENKKISLNKTFKNSPKLIKY